MRARVLLVEDDKVLLGVLKRLLLSADFDVLPASSARDALAVVNSGVVLDAVVTDFRMPEMDGLQLLAELQRCGISIPAILVTSDPTVQDSIARSGTRLVRKPIDPVELVTAIHQLLGREIS